MNKRLLRVAERRALILAKVSSQRDTLAYHIETWRRPLSFVDKGLAALRYVGNHPAWIVGSALVPAAVKPGRLGSWLRTGFLAFQMISRMRAARTPR